ncbi:MULTISPECIES: antA/AntB antirepressor family protein [Stutzerimonas stutzeri group]|uniref:antA/AntB antirepressor family protein n=1 Tax=Stutzerimonas stutzeri group TaxID=136846 RepID=UPI000D209D62|nr:MULTISPECIES: antA/AntB antirepressor family protein [Stutzerimonas stutzeri group]AVX11478.1 phage antirepressor protein [Stutzerimonas stutzeri]MBS4151961.1 phage antirepressor protein [Stutzerimonas balearica]
MTQQLIPVFNGELDGRAQQLCDARDLHSFLAVGRDFSTWVKDRIEQYGFVEGEDYSSVLANRGTFDSPNRGNQTGGRGGDRRSIDYHLTLDMAKELAMVENNDQGRQVRRYFIAMERQARESRGASYLSVSQQLAIHRQVPKLLAQLKAETAPAIRATLHAQLAQHCHLLALPVPALESVGRAKPENGELFDK